MNSSLFRDCIFEKDTISYSSFNFSDFTNTLINGVEIKFSELNSTIFKASNLCLTKIVCSDLSESDFSGVDFRFLRLLNSNMVDCAINGCIFLLMEQKKKNTDSLKTSNIYIGTNFNRCNGNIYIDSISKNDLYIDLENYNYTIAVCDSFQIYNKLKKLSEKFVKNEKGSYSNNLMKRIDDLIKLNVRFYEKNLSPNSFLSSKKVSIDSLKSFYLIRRNIFSPVLKQKKPDYCISVEDKFYQDLINEYKTLHKDQ
jgi:hypothetical protein